MLPLLCAAPAAAQSRPAAIDVERSDIVLVIDHSGSMRENDPDFLRLAAAKLFIDLADPGDRVAVVVMSGGGQTRALTRQLVNVASRDRIRELKQQIDGLRAEPMGAETHMGTALSLAYGILDQTTSGDALRGASQHQFAVLLTDGRPTGAGQREEVDAAVRQFQERRYWKVFAIALGPEADPQFLTSQVAAPSGAEVIIAEHAADLLDSYLEIYARAGDDRFIDRVEVASNADVPLVHVQAEQQPTQLTVVLIRGGPEASISGLFAPGRVDVVQPFYQNTVRRSAEPEYELYKVPLDAQVDLVGDWDINIAQPGPDPVRLVVLSRSKLRLRLPQPAPLRSEDDASLRYQPVGRPLLLIAGAQVAAKNFDDGRSFIYRWVTGMRPVARLSGPGQPDTPVPLADNGRGYDAAADDGRYTGLLPALTVAGDYRVRLDMPQHEDGAISVGKDYMVRAAALPTMTLGLPAGATTMELNQPFDVLIDLPGRSDFTIDGIAFPVAFVRRPDGVLDQVAVEGTSDGRHRFRYEPSLAGPYRISVAAEVTGAGPMGLVRYIDYDEAPFAVIQAVPEVRVTAAFTSTLTYDHGGVLRVPLTIDSGAPQPERLAIHVEGAGGARALPEVIETSPAESTRRTIIVRLPPGQAGRGELTLRFSSPTQHVLVRGEQIVVPFRSPTDLTALLAFGAAGIGGATYIVLRLRRRRRARMPIATAPRRLP
jgi:Mg-chelatase subunit ChlD